MYVRRRIYQLCSLGGVLVVRLIQLLIGLFYLDWLSRSIEFACRDQNLIDVGNIKQIHHPVEVRMKKNISTS
jgi:hypothetical protein